MAAPTYQGTGTQSATQLPTDPTPTYPASIAAGDLLLLQLYIHDTGGTVVTPDGWTIISGPTQQASGRTWLFAKRADGTESGTLTVDCTGVTGNLALCRIHRITGWNDTGTITDAFEGTNTNSGSGTTDTAASVTTTDIDRLLIIFRYFAASIASSLDSYSGGGVSWTNHVEFGTNTGNNGSIASDIAQVATATTVSGATDAITSTTWANIGLAILPVVTAASLVIPRNSQLLLRIR